MVLDKHPNANSRPDPATAEEMIQEIDRDLARSANAKERAGFLLNRANLLWLLNRASEAKEALKLALDQAPTDPETRFAFDHIMGSFLHQEGSMSEAYALLTAALSKHQKLLDLPDRRFIYEDIQRYRATELFAMGDCTDAVPVLEEILLFESTKHKSVFLANLGNCYARMKEYETARKHLLQAIERGDLHEWEGLAHYDLAKTYACLHLLQDSKREFELCAERAVKYNLPLEDVYRWLSRVCRGLGEKSESEHYAKLARPC
jgi:tetratricopeptide (TPR) repeat protein